MQAMWETILNKGDYDKDMKIILGSLFVLAFLLVIPQTFAISSLTPNSNALENAELYGQSAVITLDIKFGQDKLQPLLTRTIVHPQLESIFLSFYGDEIVLSEPELRVVGEGRHFRISSVSDGVLIYGHKNMDLDNYRINVYFATDDGLIKFPVTTSFNDEKPTESIIESYTPELMMSSSHDFKTYWKDTFNIEVQTYDGRINPSATGFEGRIDDVNITVIVSHGDDVLTTLTGTTINGDWQGEYFIQDRTTPGEYTVDILAILNEQTISKSSSMFVIGTTGSSDSSN